MNNKRIPQTIGIIFLLITTSAMQVASGQQKNNSTTIDNLKRMEVFARGTAYPPNADPETAADKTSSLIPISTVRKLGLQCIAANHKIFPYGSFVYGFDKYGEYLEGFIVDRGGDVEKRKAAINLAKRKGFASDSPEAKAMVLDFYSTTGEITKPWDTFTVIIYSGPCFKFEMNKSQKIQHMKEMCKIYGRKNNQTASR